MKPWLRFIFAVLVTTKVAAADLQTSELIDAILSEKDVLNLRIEVRKAAGRKLSADQWMEIRKKISTQQEVGYDVFTGWDKLDPKQPTSFEIQVESDLRQADQKMLQEKFEDAFAGYQGIANKLRPTLRIKDLSQLNFYNSILHSMGQALYGAGRLSDALTVFEWIPKTYFRYKKVLFEIMWTSFRLGRIDLAYGSIVSQQSTYFSKYADPETYLVETYVLKNICRDDELPRVQSKLKEFQEFLKNPTQEMYLDWARSDVETFALVLLLDRPDVGKQKFVSSVERDQEKERIRSLLKKKWEAERSRLSREVDTILGYTYVALADDSFKLQKTIIPSRDRLARQGKELWKFDGKEEWLDEVGDLVFTGESRCINSRNQH